MPIERAAVLTLFLWLTCGACVSAPPAGSHDSYPPSPIPVAFLREVVLPDGRRAREGAVRIYASHQTPARVTLAAALPSPEPLYREGLAALVKGADRVIHGGLTSDRAPPPGWIRGDLPAAQLAEQARAAEVDPSAAGWADSLAFLDVSAPPPRGASVPPPEEEAGAARRLLGARASAALVALEPLLAEGDALLLYGHRLATEIDPRLRARGFRLVETRWTIAWVEGD